MIRKIKDLAVSFFSVTCIFSRQSKPLAGAAFGSKPLAGATGKPWGVRRSPGRRGKLWERFVKGFGQSDEGIDLGGEVKSRAPTDDVPGCCSGDRRRPLTNTEGGHRM